MRYNLLEHKEGNMEKTATLNLRVNPQVKKEAEGILDQLGIPMSTAITMYLKQIVLTGGIPFAAKLPAAPHAVDADRMTDEELANLLQSRLSAVTDAQGASLDEAYASVMG